MSLGYSAVVKPGIGISVVIDGTPFNVAKDAINYNELFAALSEGADRERIRKLASPIAALRTLANNEGLEITENAETGELQVAYEGKPLRGVIASRILDLFRAEKGFEIYRKFVAKAITNRDPDAVDQLFRFMEANRLSLHPDGDVLAFKAVKSNYYDHHSGKVLYALGTTVEMPREKCDSNPNRSCSTGLHVGGDSYVKTQYSGSKMLIIKINPADFVAVPYDYNNAKARVCKLFVYAEITETAMKDVLGAMITTIPSGEKHLDKATPKEKKAPVFAPKGTAGPAKDVEELQVVSSLFPIAKAGPARDSRGHFVKRETLIAPVTPAIPVPADDDDQTERTFIHAPTGLTLTESELRAGLAKGQRAFSVETGIPRSTLQGWFKSLG